MFQVELTQSFRANIFPKNSDGNLKIIFMYQSDIMRPVGNEIEIYAAIFVWLSYLTHICQ